MAEVYGEQVGEGLADEEWLRHVGTRGWVVLLKDTKIQYRPAELGAITQPRDPCLLPDQRQPARC
jgi:hypothetical protein